MPDLICEVHKGVATLSVNRPHHNLELAAATIEAFSRTWPDPAYWDAVAEMERHRRRQG
jgi:hypothetical protein